ncbi:MAG TPA: hypothetical protein VG847_08460 [Chitinophagaceae bacterium]|nr:hypothetical protein [Chitinophagaceae bacterium]
MKHFYSLSYFKVLLFSAVIISLVSCSSTKRSTVTPNGWLVLGESKANFVREKEVIRVYSPDTYTDIQFRVEGQALKISDMSIYFDNGDRLTPRIEQTIEAGQYSNIINLADNGKKIDRIEFKYRTTGNVTKGRARIILMGKPYVENRMNSF